MKDKICISLIVLLAFVTCSVNTVACNSGGSAYHQNKRKLMKVPSRIPKGFGGHTKPK